MDYQTIFDVPDVQAVLFSVLQSVVLYLVVLLGLKMAGRRMFAEMGAQDFVVLLMVADAANLGLTHDDGGFWSSLASVAAIILLGATIEHIPVLRKLVEGRAELLFNDGRLNRRLMQKYSIEESELDETAREYGLESYRQFAQVVIEADGDLTGVVRHRASPRRKGG